MILRWVVKVRFVSGPMQIIDHCTWEGETDMMFRSSGYGAAVLWRSSAMAMEPAGPCGKSRDCASLPR